jgi:2-iminobutanoate/2-iminopropanoate deaminase
MKQAFLTEKAPKPVGPYSQIVHAGQYYFLAGQVPLTPDGKLNEGDVAAQAHQVMENLKAVLANAGLTMNEIVKTTIFLADINDFDAVNKVYSEYFSEPYPARSTVEVSRLPKGARLEIDAIAVQSEASR